MAKLDVKALLQQGKDASAACRWLALVNASLSAANSILEGSVDSAMASAMFAADASVTPAAERKKQIETLKKTLSEKTKTRKEIN